MPDITYGEDLYDCAKGADVPVIVDQCNIYRRDEVEALGFTYESTGRGAV